MADLILTEITRKVGKLNEAIIYDLTFVDIQDLQIYTSVVDTTYRNWSKNGWQHIIDNKMYGLYAGLNKTARKSSEGFTVISADSYPQLIELLTPHEIFNVLSARKEQLGLD